MSRRLGWTAALAGVMIGAIGLAIFELSVRGHLFSSPITLMAAEGGVIGIGVGLCRLLSFMHRQGRW